MEYLEGYDDYLQGRSSTENPYEYATDQYVSWENGWNAAYSESEKEDLKYD